MMTIYENFWRSNPEWLKYDPVYGLVLRDDAPVEAKESYEKYSKQVDEHEERMKLYKRQRSLRG